MLSGVALCLALCSLPAVAQQPVLNKQQAFPATVPAGNYSGLAWLGGDRYAVVNDKSAQAGFHLMSIRIDSISGQLLEVRADSFVTSGQPNRDEEGVCYVPQWNTVWISGEADGQIIEYQMDGQLTGRRLNIPDEFRTAYPNAGFEALTYQQATHRFWTISEQTLACDGEQPTNINKVANRLRLQSFDDQLQPAEQYWYESDATVVEQTECTANPRISAPSFMSSSTSSVPPCSSLATCYARNCSSSFAPRLTSPRVPLPTMRAFASGLVLPTVDKCLSSWPIRKTSIAAT